MNDDNITIAQLQFGEEQLETQLTKLDAKLAVWKTTLEKNLHLSVTIDSNQAINSLRMGFKGISKLRKELTKSIQDLQNALITQFGNTPAVTNLGNNLAQQLTNTVTNGVAQAQPAITRAMNSISLTTSFKRGKEDIFYDFRKSVDEALQVRNFDVSGFEKNFKGLRDKLQNIYATEKQRLISEGADANILDELARQQDVDIRKFDENMFRGLNRMGTTIKNTEDKKMALLKRINDPETVLLRAKERLETLRRERTKDISEIEDILATNPDLDAKGIKRAINVVKKEYNDSMQGYYSIIDKSEKEIEKRKTKSETKRAKEEIKETDPKNILKRYKEESKYILDSRAGEGKITELRDKRLSDIKDSLEKQRELIDKDFQRGDISLEDARERSHKINAYHNSKEIDLWEDYHKKASLARFLERVDIEKHYRAIEDAPNEKKRIKAMEKFMADSYKVESAHLEQQRSFINNLRTQAKGIGDIDEVNKFDEIMRKMDKSMYETYGKHSQRDAKFRFLQLQERRSGYIRGITPREISSREGPTEQGLNAASGALEVLMQGGDFDSLKPFSNVVGFSVLAGIMSIAGTGAFLLTAKESALELIKNIDDLKKSLDQIEAFQLTNLKGEMQSISLSAHITQEEVVKLVTKLKDELDGLNLESAIGITREIGELTDAVGIDMNDLTESTRLMYDVFGGNFNNIEESAQRIEKWAVTIDKANLEAKSFKDMFDLTSISMDRSTISTADQEQALQALLLTSQKVVGVGKKASSGVEGFFKMLQNKETSEKLFSVNEAIVSRGGAGVEGYNFEQKQITDLQKFFDSFKRIQGQMVGEHRFDLSDIIKIDTAPEVWRFAQEIMENGYGVIKKGIEEQNEELAKIPEKMYLAMSSTEGRVKENQMRLMAAFQNIGQAVFENQNSIFGKMAISITDWLLPADTVVKHYFNQAKKIGDVRKSIEEDMLKVKQGFETAKPTGESQEGKPLYSIDVDTLELVQKHIETINTTAPESAELLKNIIDGDYENITEERLAKIKESLKEVDNSLKSMQFIKLKEGMSKSLDDLDDAFRWAKNDWVNQIDAFNDSISTIEKPFENEKGYTNYIKVVDKYKGEIISDEEKNKLAEISREANKKDTFSPVVYDIFGAEEKFANKETISNLTHLITLMRQFRDIRFEKTGNINEWQEIEGQAGSLAIRLEEVTGKITKFKKDFQDSLKLKPTESGTSIFELDKDNREKEIRSTFALFAKDDSWIKQFETEIIDSMMKWVDAGGKVSGIMIETVDNIVKSGDAQGQLAEKSKIAVNNAGELNNQLTINNALILEGVLYAADFATQFAMATNAAEGIAKIFEDLLKLKGFNPVADELKKLSDEIGKETPTEAQVKKRAGIHVKAIREYTSGKPPTTHYGETHKTGGTSPKAKGRGSGGGGGKDKIKTKRKSLMKSLADERAKANMLILATNRTIRGTGEGTPEREQKLYQEYERYKEQLREIREEFGEHAELLETAHQIHFEKVRQITLEENKKIVEEMVKMHKELDSIEQDIAKHNALIQGAKDIDIRLLDEENKYKNHLREIREHFGENAMLMEQAEINHQARQNLIIAQYMEERRKKIVEQLESQITELQDVRQGIKTFALDDYRRDLHNEEYRYQKDLKKIREQFGEHSQIMEVAYMVHAAKIFDIEQKNQLKIIEEAKKKQEEKLQKTREAQAEIYHFVDEERNRMYGLNQKGVDNEVRQELDKYNIKIALAKKFNLDYSELEKERYMATLAIYGKEMENIRNQIFGHQEKFFIAKQIYKDTPLLSEHYNVKFGQEKYSILKDELFFQYARLKDELILQGNKLEGLERMTKEFQEKGTTAEAEKAKFEKPSPELIQARRNVERIKVEMRSTLEKLGLSSQIPFSDKSEEFLATLKAARAKNWDVDFASFTAKIEKLDTQMKDLDIEIKKKEAQIPAIPEAKAPKPNVKETEKAVKVNYDLQESEFNRIKSLATQAKALTTDKDVLAIINKLEGYTYKDVKRVGTIGELGIFTAGQVETLRKNIGDAKGVLGDFYKWFSIGRQESQAPVIDRKGFFDRTTGALPEEIRKIREENRKLKKGGKSTKKDEVVEQEEEDTEGAEQAAQEAFNITQEIIQLKKQRVQAASEIDSYKVKINKLRSEDIPLMNKNVELLEQEMKKLNELESADKSRVARLEQLNLMMIQAKDGLEGVARAIPLAFSVDSLSYVDNFIKRMELFNNRIDSLVERFEKLRRKYIDTNDEANKFSDDLDEILGIYDDWINTQKITLGGLGISPVGNRITQADIDKGFADQSQKIGLVIQELRNLMFESEKKPISTNITTGDININNPKPETIEFGEKLQVTPEPDKDAVRHFGVAPAKDRPVSAERGATYDLQNYTQNEIKKVKEEIDNLENLIKDSFDPDDRQKLESDLSKKKILLEELQKKSEKKVSMTPEKQLEFVFEGLATKPYQTALGEVKAEQGTGVMSSADILKKIADKSQALGSLSNDAVKSALQEYIEKGKSSNEKVNQVLEELKKYTGGTLPLTPEGSEKILQFLLTLQNVIKQKVAFLDTNVFDNLPKAMSNFLFDPITGKISQLQSRVKDLYNNWLSKLDSISKDRIGLTQQEMDILSFKKDIEEYEKTKNAIEDEIRLNIVKLQGTLSSKTSDYMRAQLAKQEETMKLAEARLKNAQKLNEESPNDATASELENAQSSYDYLLSQNQIFIKMREKYVEFFAQMKEIESMDISNEEKVAKTQQIFDDIYKYLESLAKLGISDPILADMKKAIDAYKKQLTGLEKASAEEKKVREKAIQAKKEALEESTKDIMDSQSYDSYYKQAEQQKKAATDEYRKNRKTLEGNFEAQQELMGGGINDVPEMIERQEQYKKNIEELEDKYNATMALIHTQIFIKAMDDISNFMRGIKEFGDSFKAALKQVQSNDPRTQLEGIGKMGNSVNGFMGTLGTAIGNIDPVVGTVVKGIGSFIGVFGTLFETIASFIEGIKNLEGSEIQGIKDNLSAALIDNNKKLIDLYKELNNDLADTYSEYAGLMGKHLETLKKNAAETLGFQNMPAVSDVMFGSTWGTGGNFQPAFEWWKDITSFIDFASSEYAKGSINQGWLDFLTSTGQTGKEEDIPAMLEWAKSGHQIEYLQGEIGNLDKLMADYTQVIAKMEQNKDVLTADEQKDLEFFKERLADLQKTKEGYVEYIQTLRELQEAYKANLELERQMLITRAELGELNMYDAALDAYTRLQNELAQEAAGTLKDPVSGTLIKFSDEEKLAKRKELLGLKDQYQQAVREDSEFERDVIDHNEKMAEKANETDKQKTDREKKFAKEKIKSIDEQLKAEYAILAEQIQQEESEERVQEQKRRIMSLEEQRLQLQRLINGELDKQAGLSDNILRGLILQREQLLNMRNMKTGQFSTEVQSRLAMVEAQIKARLIAIGTPPDDIERILASMRIQRFKEGGEVRGPYNQPVMVMAEGGEVIVSNPQLKKVGGKVGLDTFLQNGYAKIGQQIFMSSNNLSAVQNVGGIYISGHNFDDVMRMLEPMITKNFNDNITRWQQNRGNFRG